MLLFAKGIGVGAKGMGEMHLIPLSAAADISSNGVLRTFSDAEKEDLLT